MRRCVRPDPADLDARLESFFGIWLAIAGRHGGVEMGASHAIGHVLGGSCGVPHGYTSCVMLPHVLRYNRAVNAERQRLVAEALGHPGRMPPTCWRISSPSSGCRSACRT